MRIIKKNWNKTLITKNKNLIEVIENELIAVEKEIESLKKTSISNINKIAVEISSEIINRFLEQKLTRVMFLQL